MSAPTAATAQTSALACHVCCTAAPEARVQPCRICGQPFCLGCAYLMRGDPYCSKACGYAHKFPDEGQVYTRAQRSATAAAPAAGQTASRNAAQATGAARG